MAIVIPASGTAWKEHRIVDGSCLSISVPAGSSAKLWTELPAQGDMRLEVSVGAGATFELLTVQEGATGMVRAEGRIAEGASMRWRAVTLGGTAEHSIRSECVGEGATSAASWIVVARGGDYPRAVMRNAFDAHNGAGEVAMRAVALAHGQALLDGRIEIGLGGGGTQTYLTQEALMLDSSAKIDAIPGLEIKTNDVKASHSATVSRVNPDDVFYAGSRGIAPDAARRLLVEGFLGKLLGDIDDESLRTDLLARIIRQSLETDRA